MGSHMFQHVRRRLNRPLANLVHADLVPAVFASHMSTTCNVSGRFVHGLSLRSIGGRHRAYLGQRRGGAGCWKATGRSQSLSQNGTVQGHEDAHTQQIDHTVAENEPPQAAGFPVNP